MKQILIGLMITVMGVVGFSHNAGAVDNFTIKSYDAKYVLGRDSDGRSTLEATHTIVADFPPNENRGIAPKFVRTYEGHSTEFSIKSITDENGKALNFSQNGDEIRIGDKNVYVQGLKTYVIKYTQRDITKFYKDTDKDEFYWDLIGVEWRVPIEKATASVTFTGDLAGARNTQAYCYYGAAKSTTQCTVEDNGDVVKMGPLTLGKSEGVTFSVGFPASTFKEYQPDMVSWITGLWFGFIMHATPIWIVLAIIASNRKTRITGRKKELGTIVPEYIPPKGVSVRVAASVIGRHEILFGSAFVAQLLDLAVRHYIRIYETEKGIFKTRHYEIEIIKDVSALRPEEIETISDMFSGKVPQVGDRLELKKLQNNMKYTKLTRDDDDNIKKITDDELGLLEFSQTSHDQLIKLSRIYFWLGILMAVSPPILITSMVLKYQAAHNKTLSEEGLKLRRYLEGLKMYIKVAEEERLKVLQSPEGAMRAQVDPNDSAQMIKLYERLLPYAVLFGQADKWSEALGKYYDIAHQTPDWYSSHRAFSTLALMSSIQGLSASAMQASSYSSSSGGSSGGGFSGGGGGGGGGGGW